MSAEQIVVLVLLVAAFAAGWIANGTRREQTLDGPDGVPGTDDDPVSPVDAPALEGPILDEPPVGPSEPPFAEERDVAGSAEPSQPGEHGYNGVSALRALDRAVQAFEHAVDHWLEDRDGITPAGRASLGELDRAIGRLDAAVDRCNGDDPRAARLAGGALDALREMAELLGGYRDGRSLDPETSRELDALEDEVAEARDTLEQALAR